MEDLCLKTDFYRNKKVLVTGHTGFKGAWLSLWLSMLGANVIGISLEPEPGCLYEGFGKLLGITSIYEDIRNLENIKSIINSVKPEIIIHLAAYSFLKEAQLNPVRTFTTNLMGGVNLLEAVRLCKSVRSFVIVTTDKVYDNKGLERGYGESDPLGAGLEVYSGSKACLEFAVESYRNAYFHPDKYDEHGIAMSTARASNVLGGGDHIKSRIVPSILQSLSMNEDIIIRNPYAIRPWQNVLDALCGYLTLAQNLYLYGTRFSGAWNFGPDESGIQTVEWLVQSFIKSWGGNSSYIVTDENPVREAGILKLDITKSTHNLGWKPIRNLELTINETVHFYKGSLAGVEKISLCQKQIENYMRDLLI